MLETGVWRADREGRPLTRWNRADHAVSPVIGMILVLGISVVGISAVVYWGLPAIDEMKANVEFRSAESQFHELDATMKELVAGTTQRTAKRWQPSIARGEITIHENTQGWLYATETYDPVRNNSFVYAQLTDGDNAFIIKNVGSAAITNVKVEGYIVNGATETLLQVSGGTAIAPAQMVGANLPTWAVNGEYEFKTWTVSSGTAQNINDAVFHFKIFESATLIGEAWFMNAGHVQYKLDAGLGNKEVVQTNGAVLTGVSGIYTIENSPSIPPPVLTGGTYRFFGRAVVIDGTAGFAGADRFDALLSLYATKSLASYDCASTAKTDCVESSKIFIFGDYQAPWHAYLTNTNRGYSFTATTQAFTGFGAPSVTFLEDRQTAGMAYTLIESVIQVKS